MKYFLKTDALSHAMLIVDGKPENFKRVLNYPKEFHKIIVIRNILDIEYNKIDNQSSYKIIIPE